MATANSAAVKKGVLKSPSAANNPPHKGPAIQPIAAADSRRESEKLQSRALPPSLQVVSSDKALHTVNFAARRAKMQAP